jgi:hypothetical protein
LSGAIQRSQPRFVNAASPTPFQLLHRSGLMPFIGQLPQFSGNWPAFVTRYSCLRI